MLRLIGAIIIIGSTATFGLGSLRRMGARVRILSALISALELMKSEICDRMTPMPELIEGLAEEADPPVDRFFARVGEGMQNIGARSFYFIWKAALEDSPELELTEQEKKTLADLGHTLGRYDTEEQGAALAYTVRRMEGYLRRAEDERRDQGKVHAALGVAAGVFVVIILL